MDKDVDSIRAKHVDRLYRDLELCHSFNPTTIIIITIDIINIKFNNYGQHFIMGKMMWIPDRLIMQTDCTEIFNCILHSLYRDLQLYSSQLVQRSSTVSFTACTEIFNCILHSLYRDLQLYSSQLVQRSSTVFFTACTEIFNCILHSLYRDLQLNPSLLLLSLSSLLLSLTFH